MLLRPVSKVHLTPLVDALDDGLSHAEYFQVAGIGIVMLFVAGADEGLASAEGLDTTSIERMQAGDHHISAIEQLVYILLRAMDAFQEGIPPTVVGELEEGVSHLPAWAVIEMQMGIWILLDDLYHGSAEYQGITLSTPVFVIENGGIPRELVICRYLNRLEAL